MEGEAEEGRGAAVGVDDAEEADEGRWIGEITFEFSVGSFETSLMHFFTNFNLESCIIIIY